MYNMIVNIQYIVEMTSGKDTGRGRERNDAGREKRRKDHQRNGNRSYDGDSDSSSSSAEREIKENDRRRDPPPQGSYTYHCSVVCYITGNRHNDVITI